METGGNEQLVSGKSWKKIQTGALKTAWVFLLILRRNLLSVLTFVSLVAGWILGLTLVALRPSSSSSSSSSSIKWTPREISYVKFPGEIGANILNGFSLPLFMSCVISSLGSMNLRFGLVILYKAIPVFMLSSYLGLMTGLGFYWMMSPGNKVEDCRNLTDPTVKDFLAQDLFYDVTRKWFQASLVGTMLENPYTELDPPVVVMGNQSVVCKNCPLEDFKINVMYDKRTNYRGLLTFCVLFGLATSRAGLYGRPVLTFAHSMAEAMLRLSRWAVWAVPAATVSLIASELVQMANSSSTMEEYKWLLLTHAAAVFFYGFAFLPGLYFLFTRKLPFVFMGKIIPAVIISFATQRSLTAMPIVLQCLDDVGVRPHVSRSLVPVMFLFAKPGNTIYMSVDALFVAECHGRGKDINFLTNFILSLFVWAADFCGVDLYFGVGLAAKQVFGLQPQFVGSTKPVDWLISAVDTTGNVLNYCFLAVFMDQLFSAQLNLLPPFNQLLREGLILKRLSEVAAQASQVNEPASLPHILLNHSNAMAAAAEKRNKEKLEQSSEILEDNGPENKHRQSHRRQTVKIRSPGSFSQPKWV